MFPIYIVGNSSVYDGQHLVYFEKALGSLTPRITHNVGAALKKVGLDPYISSGICLRGKLGAVYVDLDSGLMGWNVRITKYKLR